ncbi:hypothetical protein PZ895_01545 [Mesorhizobium sp. YIM 152430]|uniref:hypothetical protein n=1 Tax=Mesorhizobium sp. YIM 152430 TaxID=3031761 RepID=UPI0023DBD251|nr:hypothetical protein [Mesorhizobium sp. YIM 152430]MDF1598456.1 hypothetical protein [Mesorhizobium sp. YIM 152430]
MAIPRLPVDGPQHNAVAIEGLTAGTKMQSVVMHDHSSFGLKVNGRNMAAEALWCREFPMANLYRSA